MPTKKLCDLSVPKQLQPPCCFVFYLAVLHWLQFGTMLGDYNWITPARTAQTVTQQMRDKREREREIWAFCFFFGDSRHWMTFHSLPRCLFVTVQRLWFNLIRVSPKKNFFLAENQGAISSAHCALKSSLCVKVHVSEKKKQKKKESSALAVHTLNLAFEWRNICCRKALSKHNDGQCPLVKAFLSWATTEKIFIFLNVMYIWSRVTKWRLPRWDPPDAPK